MTKKILVMILAVCLAVVGMTVMAMADVVIGNGWTLDTYNGELRFTSNSLADMSDWIDKKDSYAAQVKMVVFGEDVTEIVSVLLQGCTNLTSVTFEGDVTSIGAYAFYGCSSLTSINIPSSVTTIGDSAFEGCSKLTSIDIPSSVKTIGCDAFAGTGLKSVTLGCGTSYDSYSFPDDCNVIQPDHTYAGGICTVCGADDPDCISIAGTKLSDGDSYSGTTGTATYKDGVLTLNNFTLTVTDDTTAIYSANDLTIKISGTNTISSKMVGIDGNVKSIIVDTNATLEVSSTADAALLIGEAVIQPASGAILEVQAGNNMTYCSSDMRIYIGTDQTFTIKPHTHTYSTDVTEPTCTEGGYTTYTCACGDSYVADETAATGHSYTVSWSWDGTSAMATVSCSDCGDSYEQQAAITTQSNYGQTIYIAIVRVGDVTYTTSKTTGTITIPTTDSTSEVTTEEVETEEPVEGTDTETEADDEAEANPTTGIVVAMLPMAIAVATAVASKQKLR